MSDKNVHNFFDLTGKAIVVTGASKGLGRGFAKALARAGAQVLGIARDEPMLKELQEELSGEGHSFDYLLADILDEEAIASDAKFCKAQYGKVDALVIPISNKRIDKRVKTR